MVTDEHYRFRTQSKNQGGFTRMALIRPFYDPARQLLSLAAPDVPDCTIPVQWDGREEECKMRKMVTVFDDVCEAIDQGNVVAEWLSRFLGAPSRLVRMEGNWYRPVDPVFSPERAPISFADAFPILLISDASLLDLNWRLEARGCDPVSRENFRAAFWASGCEPYEEDTWKRLRIGGIFFDVVKPCARCSITQVDWQKGVYREDQEPLVTLRTYRHQTIPQTGKQGVMFGQNLVHRGLGEVCVGDEIEILERK
jgi:MOSC domain-containing protein